MVKARTNSVISLSAQINKLCQPVMAADLETNELRALIKQNITYLGDYYYLFMLMERSGARVSEVLQIRHQDITESGQILIRGLKGSENRIIQDSEVSQFCSKKKRLQLDPFQRLNRFSAYRLLKGIGIGKLKKGRKNTSITHIFRDNYIHNLRTLEISNRDLSKSIGHKSIKSTEYYGKD